MGIQTYAPWNKGKLVGQKLPLKQREIWSIRVRLQLANKTRDLALFNLAIDSKLRGCDLVSLRVMDLGDCSRILGRAVVMQQKTKRPVQFEITEGTRQALWPGSAKDICVTMTSSSQVASGRADIWGLANTAASCTAG
jgi:hypothetical protein